MNEVSNEVHCQYYRLISPESDLKQRHDFLSKIFTVNEQQASNSEEVCTSKYEDSYQNLIYALEKQRALNNDVSHDEELNSSSIESQESVINNANSLLIESKGSSEEELVNNENSQKEMHIVKENRLIQVADIKEYMELEYNDAQDRCWQQSDIASSTLVSLDYTLYLQYVEKSEWTGNFFHLNRATGQFDNISNAESSSSQLGEYTLSKNALNKANSDFGVSEHKASCNNFTAHLTKPINYQQSQINIKPQVDRAQVNVDRNITGRDVFALFAHYKPLTHAEFTKTYLRTFKSEEGIRVLYRDYFGKTEKNKLVKMLECLADYGNSSVTLTYNGQTEVIYGNSTSR